MGLVILLEHMIVVHLIFVRDKCFLIYFFFLHANPNLSFLLFNDVIVMFLLMFTFGLFVCRRQISDIFLQILTVGVGRLFVGGIFGIFLRVGVIYFVGGIYIFLLWYNNLRYKFLNNTYSLRLKHITIIL